MVMAKAWQSSALGLRGMASVTSTDKGGSSSPDKGKHVDVPLPMHGVAGKYAEALFVTAVRSNTLDPVRADLEQMASVADMDTLFSQFMKDPSVPKPARMKACEEIFKETKFNDVSKNFMYVLAENGRLGWIRSIYKNYHDLFLAHRGELKVEAITALEFTAAEKEELKNAVAGSSLVAKGANVIITSRVDRSIIGGFKLSIGDKSIDLSIERKILLMEKVLAEAI